MRTVQIAPGVKYAAWTFNGTAPGPIVHVREGQMVDVAITNRDDDGMMHSVDFHAAQIAPNLAFTDVMKGETKHFRFRASTPGVFMYHCGTAPALMHIANGMYGAIVVDPARPLPHADRS
jgi:nitrite reductase (NO-forming)